MLPSKIERNAMKNDGKNKRTDLHKYLQNDLCGRKKENRFELGDVFHTLRESFFVASFDSYFFPFEFFYFFFGFISCVHNIGRHIHNFFFLFHIFFHSARFCKCHLKWMTQKRWKTGKKCINKSIKLFYWLAMAIMTEKYLKIYYIYEVAVRVCTCMCVYRMWLGM